MNHYKNRIQNLHACLETITEWWGQFEPCDVILNNGYPFAASFDEVVAQFEYIFSNELVSFNNIACKISQPDKSIIDIQLVETLNRTCQIIRSIYDMDKEIRDNFSNRIKNISVKSNADFLYAMLDWYSHVLYHVRNGNASIAEPVFEPNLIFIKEHIGKHPNMKNIVVPIGTTNGEVFMLLWKDVPVKVRKYFDGIIDCYEVSLGDGSIMRIKSSWWDAPYRYID